MTRLRPGPHKGADNREALNRTNTHLSTQVKLPLRCTHSLTFTEAQADCHTIPSEVDSSLLGLSTALFTQRGQQHSLHCVWLYMIPSQQHHAQKKHLWLCGSYQNTEIVKNVTIVKWVLILLCVVVVEV